MRILGIAAAAVIGCGAGTKHPGDYDSIVVERDFKAAGGSYEDSDLQGALRGMEGDVSLSRTCCRSEKFLARAAARATVRPFRVEHIPGGPTAD